MQSNCCNEPHHVRNGVNALATSTISSQIVMAMTFQHLCIFMASRCYINPNIIMTMMDLLFQCSPIP